MNHFHGKTVLVTGAGGSIGSEIARRLASMPLKHLLLVGHSEQPLYDVMQTIKEPVAPTSTHLASVTDERAMDQLLPGVDIVIHAAAHKHVPLCEENPVEAVKNNVGGFMTLANAASRYSVGQVILVSSDKAVRPKSVMGATKRACELFARFLEPRATTRFTTVRFGNVLNSSGSVLPLWRAQLARGEKITLTDKRCTRYFMEIPQAVDLVLHAAAERSATYMLDMGPPKNLYDLALQTIHEFDGSLTYKGCPIICDTDRITVAGLRPGEKLEEELWHGGEAVVTKVRGLLRIVENDTGRLIRWTDFNDLLMAAKLGCRERTLKLLWELVS